jgi:hypothetical protein
LPNKRSISKTRMREVWRELMFADCDQAANATRWRQPSGVAQGQKPPA